MITEHKHINNNKEAAKKVKKSGGLIFLIIIFFILCNRYAFSQELPLYSQYMLNNYLLNPANAGVNQHSSLVLTDRHQWLGIVESPNAQSLSVQGRLRDVGLAGHVFNYSKGFINRKGFQLTYAFHVLLQNYSLKALTPKGRQKLRFSYRARRRKRSDRYLSFGLSFTGFQHQIDYGPLNTQIDNDPALGFAQENNFYPDANFGLLYYTPNFYAGLSVAQLFQPRVNLRQEYYEGNVLPRTFFLSTGYSFEFENMYKEVFLEVEPSITLKATQNLKERQADGNLRVYYMTDYWIGASYRHYLDDLPGQSASLIFYAGFPIFENLYFAYGYDVTMTDIGKYSGSTHEFKLEYVFHRVRKNKFCPYSTR